MMQGRIGLAALAAAFALTQGAPARADGDAIVGGIIGGIIGGAIANGAKSSNRTRTTTRSSGVSTAQREANREVQVALNHFGFPVGTPDGAIGPKSRAAISEYQAMLGFPATGQLTEFERGHLVTSYHRAVAGGALTVQQAAQTPMGMKGLLVTWRDEALGIAPQASATAAAPAPADPNPFKETEAVEDQAGATLAAAPEAGAAALPNFMAAAPAATSLASHCNKVSLRTSTNGGYLTVASMTDPMQALGEQFCLARGYSIALGEELAAQVQGFTPEQIAQQCGGFGPAMQAQRAALSLKPADEVLREVEGFALSTGMAPEQLAGTARICLSVGYRTDDMDVAVSSALLLAALGEGAYGELLGHHLSQGFGATQRPDLALAWYERGLDAAAVPAEAVFAPDQAGRLDLIRRAAFAIGGRPDQAALPEAVPAALPSFNLPAMPEAPAEVAVAAPVAEPAEPAVTVQAAAEAPADPAMAAVAAPVNAIYGVAKLPLLLLGN